MPQGSFEMERLRPAGMLERLYLAMHSKGMFYSVGITSVYRIPHTLSPEDSRTSFEDNIYAACATVISQLPNLSVTPDDQCLPTPSFIRLPEVDIDKCIFIIHDSISDLDEFLEKQHNTPFPPFLPMWKLYITNIIYEPSIIEFNASFVFHHGLGDGMSGLIFHKKFATALAEYPHFNTPCERKVATPRITLPLPLDALHPLPVSLWYVLKTSVEELWPFGRDPSLWTGNVVTLPLKSRYKSFKIEEQKTAEIVRICRDHSTSVTTLLQEIVSYGLFEVLPTEYTTLNSVIAVSTRRWLNSAVGEDQMGLFVTSHGKKHTRLQQTKDLPLRIRWDEAADSARKLRLFLETNGRNNWLGLMRRYIKDIPRFLDSRVGAPRALSFEVSNLGVYRNDDALHSGVVIQEMVFSQTISAIDSAIQVSVVTRGSLTVGFSWQEGIVAQDIIMPVIEKVKGILDNIEEYA